MKKITRRNFMKAASAGAMLSAFALTGCGGETGSSSVAASSASTSSSKEEPVEPVDVTLVFADGDEGAKELMNNIVDNFNATYPEYNIIIQPGDGSSYNEILKTKESVGEFPDIVEMRDTGIYVRAGMLAPISDELKALFKTTVSFDDVVYTAPNVGSNTLGMMYNKTYFEEKGLKEPTTWDELIELCQQISDFGDMSPLVVGAGDIWHLGFLYQACYGNNVTVADKDFIACCYSGEKTFADETFIQTIEDLSEIMMYAQEGWASTPDAQITTFLVNDMSAMLFSGTHMFQQIADAAPDFDLGWFPVPARDGKVHLIGGGGAGGWAFNIDSAQDPKKQAAFDEFIKFFFDPAQYKVYLETMSFLPTTVVDPKLDVAPIMQEVIDATNSADSLGLMWNGQTGDNELPPDFRNFTYKTMIEVAQGTRDIDSAVTELQKTWDVAVQNFNPVTGVGLT